MAVVKARSSLFPLVAGAAILLNCGPIRAEDWPQWRGPHFNGSSTEKGLPSAWSKDDALWRTDLPGPSAATPVIWSDHVFVSTAETASKSLRSEEHTSELQSPCNLVCRLLLE